MLQFYVAVADAVESDTPGEGVQAFFLSYLAAVVVLAFYVGGYLWKREAWKTLASIDVDSGRRAIDSTSFEAQKAKQAHWPAWRRTLHMLY